VYSAPGVRSENAILPSSPTVPHWLQFHIFCSGDHSSRSTNPTLEIPLGAVIVTGTVAPPAAAAGVTRPASDRAAAAMNARTVRGNVFVDIWLPPGKRRSAAGIGHAPGSDTAGALFTLSDAGGPVLA